MMIRLRFVTCTGAILLACCLAGCSSAPPGPRQPVPTLEPIAVDGETVAAITFPDLVINVEPDKLLGYHFEGAGMAKAYDYRWGPNFSDETDELNYDVISRLEDAGYRTFPWPDEGSPRPESGENLARLGGTVELIEFNSFTTAGGYYQAYCEVSWELTDLSSGKSIFMTRTTGYNRESEHTAGIIGRAFHGALDNLLADEGFVAAASGE